MVAEKKQMDEIKKILASMHPKERRKWEGISGVDWECSGNEIRLKKLFIITSPADHKILFLRTRHPFVFVLPLC